jgi:hypothetical protein
VGSAQEDGGIEGVNVMDSKWEKNIS